MRTSKRLRAAIDGHRETQGEHAFRYPLQLKQAVAEYVRSRRSAGVSYETLVGELGLSINTLRRWSEGRREGRLAKVSLTNPTPSLDLVLVTRTGHRVEGLSISSLGDLLERLS